MARAPGVRPEFDLDITEDNMLKVMRTRLFLTADYDKVWFFGFFFFFLSQPQ
jgi:hypothetical protein